MSRTNKGGERIVADIWDSGESPPRTKLRASLVKKLGAEAGKYLNFFKAGGGFVVRVSGRRDPDAAWSMQVDVETRARVTDAHLEQLGAELGDRLLFTTLPGGGATVEVLKAREGFEAASPDEDAPEPFSLPDELEEGQTYIEGAARQVTLNAYERDPRARRDCLRHHGTDCSVCGFSFAKTFGEIGEGYIHVHHLTPLSEVRGEYELDPVKDLRPVCANCHAMLHRRKPPYSIEELRGIIGARRRGE